jgi:NAD(P)-dependent dehydrogenase (short-subunit alcohol dehydrogenase family)
VDEIKALGGVAVACVEDLSTEEGAIKAIQRSVDSFDRIDGLVHNAGISPPMYSPDTLSSEQLDLVMRVNIYAAFWMTRAAWPHMKHQGGGRIVYTASHSIFGAQGSAAYAAAKSAYLGMMLSIAPEGAPLNILCNIVAPTARTRMTERMPASPYTEWLFETMDPARVSPAVAYLLSDKCRIFGQILSVAGGRIACIRLAESAGVMGVGDTIERVHEALETVLAQDQYYYPRDATERISLVHGSMGYKGPSLTAKSFSIVEAEPR